MSTTAARTTGTTVDELGRRRRARTAQSTDPVALAENLRADYDRWLSHLGGAAGCAETYRADTYQLVTAGLVGGKDIPATVTEHPCVFLTITAPSFGEVHSHRTDANGRLLPCHPRRDTEPCEHGQPLTC